MAAAVGEDRVVMVDVVGFWCGGTRPFIEHCSGS